MISQVALSDMSLAGNPLVYVNQAWCETTGYSREEVLGRNCRLLQGPQTQAAAVRKMVAALRDGSDVCVRITNYRKSGEVFDNLVALRPVLDSNGVYRFCLSLALEVKGLTSYIIHLTSYTLHLTSLSRWRALPLTSYLLHLTSYTLHLTSCTLPLTSLSRWRAGSRL